MRVWKLAAMRQCAPVEVWLDTVQTHYGRAAGAYGVRRTRAGRALEAA